MAFFVFSCNNNQKNETKIKDSAIKNFTLSGIKNNQKNFELQAKSAQINNNNNISIENASFTFFENNNKNYQITSKTGNYDQKNKVFKLHNNKLIFQNKFNLNAQELIFSERNNQLKGKKIKLKFYKNNIIAEELEGKNDSNKIILKKVFAKLNY